MSQQKAPGAPFSGDPRDTYVAPEDVNAGSNYVMYSVFDLDVALPSDDAERARRFWEGVLETSLAARGPAEGEGWQADLGGVVCVSCAGTGRDEEGRREVMPENGRG